MSVSKIVATITTALSICSVIVGFIFLFVEIKNKKYISAKTGKWVVIVTCAGVFAIALSYQFGWKAASENVFLDTSKTDTSVAESENVAVTEIGDIIIEGDNNAVSIRNETNRGGITEAVVQQVTLNYTALDMVVGDTDTLLATVIYSDNSYDNSVKWWSSNPSVAAVDSDGNVIAMAAGTTTITAQASKNNVAESESCTVTVANPPSEPTGYSIRLSTNEAGIKEVFKVYVTPNEEDIKKIQIYTISPSGLLNDFPLSDDGRYYIDTETGIWTIYASVENEAGVYMAQKPEDYVTIEILSVMDTINNMLQ